MTTGQRIKAARKKAGLTQKELAEQSGVAAISIHQYEAGKRHPQLEQLLRIATALQVSIQELMDPEDIKRIIIYGDDTLEDKKLYGTAGMMARLHKLQNGEPLFLSPDDLAKLKSLPKEQLAAALDEQEEREQEERHAIIAALKAQMEKMRQRYGPDAFPEFDELGALLHKFQSGAITQSEQEQTKTLFATVQARLKEYSEMAPSPDDLLAQSPLSRQDEELREEWNKLSLSDIFIIPGNHDIGPVSQSQRKRTVSRSMTKTLIKRPQMLDYGDSETAPFIHSIEGRAGSGKSTVINRLTKITEGPLYRVAVAMDKLNEEGQEKAAERVEELTEIPRYQAQEPPTEPSGAPGGTDTTPPETPPEGRIQAITMVCPICGMALRGDLEDGQAHCDYCKRSFPLPKVLK